MAVTQQPSRQLLVKDELDVLVAAPGERHDERPGPAQFTAGRIVQQTGKAEVHLGLRARFALDPHKDFRLGRGQAADKTPDRRVAAGVTAFFEPLLDGGHLDPFLVQLAHQRPIRLNG